MAQHIMVVQIFITQRQPEHPLAHQRRHFVLDQRLVAAIGEAARKPVNQSDRPIRRSQQQNPGIRRDRPAVKRGHHGATFNTCKTKQIRATLCLHRGDPLEMRKPLRHNDSLRVQAPMHLLSLRNAG